MSMSSEMALENAGGTRSIAVWAQVTPETVDEVCDAVRRSAGLLSVSGARYSPDSQYAQAGALHLDISRLNRVVRLELLTMRVTVQAGIRWFDLLRFLQPHGLSVRVMPAFANFTVGGSISSNQASPHLGCGPVGEGVTALTLVMADGSVRTVRPEIDGDLFRAIVGGFGGLGVIVEAELELAPNTPLLRRSHPMTADQYPDFFRSRIQSDAGARLHSAEFDAPTFERLRAVTWVETELAPTHQQPLHYPGIVDPLRQVLDWSQPSRGLSRLYRRAVVEPLAAARKTVHWRNYEASHDLEAFDPKIHEKPLYEFHEFGIPLARFGDFHEALRRIVARYQVPAVRLTVTHYGPCTRSLLALADSDSAFHCRLVTRTGGRRSRNVAHDPDVWARELVQAAIDCGGRFDPAFRMVATREQFEQAFPSSLRLVRIKRDVDPLDRFGNGFWRHFYDLPSTDPVTVFLPMEAAPITADGAPPLWRPPTPPARETVAARISAGPGSSRGGGRRPTGASPSTDPRAGGGFIGARAASDAGVAAGLDAPFDDDIAIETGDGPDGAAAIATSAKPILAPAKGGGAAAGSGATPSLGAAAGARAGAGAGGTGAGMSTGSGAGAGAGTGMNPGAGAASGATAGAEAPTRARRNRATAAEPKLPHSEFAMAWSQPVPRDNLYRILRELAPGNKAPRLFQMLAQQIERNDDDELIYRNLRRSLMKWQQSWHAAVSMRAGDWTAPLIRRLLTYTSARHADASRDDPRRIDGYAEIGTLGLMTAALRPGHRLTGDLILLDDEARPVADERLLRQQAGGGGLGRWLGRGVGAPTLVGSRAFGLPARVVAPDRSPGDAEDGTPFGNEASLDLITAFSGLRGLADPALRLLLDDMMDALRPGGLVLVLDHDADGPYEALEASVALRLAALCNLQTWEQSEAWAREFRSVDDASAEFADAGFEEVAGREKVARTPWGNLLSAFRKPVDPAF